MASEMEVYSSLAQFSSELYSQVAADQTTEVHNVFMSTLSVYLALLMTLVGTGGQTRTEMRNSLRVPSHLQGEEFHKSVGSTLMKQFVDSQDVNVSLANRLFILRNVQLREEFKKILEESYLAEAELLTEGDLDAKRQRVNQWVSEKTKSKIPELLSPGAFTPNTVLTIVNAVYFKGFWKRPFNKNFTKIAPFNCLDGTSIQVPMMFMKERQPHEDLTDLNAAAVKLQFGDSLWELLIVLPNKQDGLPGLLTQFRNKDTLTSILAKPFYRKSVNLYLPRFKLAELPPLDMKKLLQNSGMKSLFKESADLTNLSSEENLYVSDLAHKAVIEVDEEGAEAAAATGVLISLTSFTETIQFRVDHPFILALVYNSSVPTFIGHVTRPEVE